MAFSRSVTVTVPVLELFAITIIIKTMASGMRRTMLRQGCPPVATRRTFCAKPPPAAVFLKAAIRPTPTKSKAWEAPLVAAFHASSPKAILPPGPQVVNGTVNDPAPIPKPSPTHGSYHWTFERALSVGLVPLTIAPFAAGSLNPVLDAAFVAAILLHSHLGFSSLVTDYIPKWQHPTARKFFDWALKAATLVVGVGFYEFETNDVGLTEGVKRIWKAGSPHSPR